MSLKLPMAVAARLRSVSAVLASSVSPIALIWLRASQSVVSFFSGASPSICVTWLGLGLGLGLGFRVGAVLGVGVG